VKLSYRGSGSADPSCLVAVLTDLEWWASWIPGIHSSEVLAQTNAVVVVMTLGGPRPMELSVEVNEHPDGLLFRMVEGDFVAVDGEVTVAEHPKGAQVTWLLSLTFPSAIPGSLVSELRHEMLPAWNAALFTAARGKSDQSVG
jgi:hypothetical protein